MGNIQIPDNFKRQDKQIVRIIDSYRMVTSFKNVTGAFKKPGIVPLSSVVSIRDLKIFDKFIRTQIRQWVEGQNLPKAMIYAHWKDGRLNMPPKATRQIPSPTDPGMGKDDDGHQRH